MKYAVLVPLVIGVGVYYEFKRTLEAIDNAITEAWKAV